MDLISADWPAPDGIHTLVTLRTNGSSVGAYSSLNLGDHVGDDFNAVLLNRQALQAVLPSAPIWMRQIHGTSVSNTLSRLEGSTQLPEADAAITDRPSEVLAVLTADCMPVFFCSDDGKHVGIAHAGWRGLCAGILQNTLDALVKQSGGLPQSAFMAWLGPAIGPNHFEVGEDVIEAFANHGFPIGSDSFIPIPSSWLGPAIGPNHFEVGEDVIEAFANHGFQIGSDSFIPIPSRPNKYLGNLALLAHQALQNAGIERIYGGDLCTYSDPKRFFSHRRDGVSGRFASLIWIQS